MVSEMKICENLYDILGVEQSASQNDIKRAFRSLTRQWHPDRNVNNVEDATEKYKMITHAYEVLFDEQTRRRYDDSRLVAPFLLTKRSVRRRRVKFR